MARKSPSPLIGLWLGRVLLLWLVYDSEESTDATFFAWYLAESRAILALRLGFLFTPLVVSLAFLIMKILLRDLTSSFIDKDLHKPDLSIPTFGFKWPTSWSPFVLEMESWDCFWYPSLVWWVPLSLVGFAGCCCSESVTWSLSLLCSSLLLFVVFPVLLGC